MKRYVILIKNKIKSLLEERKVNQYYPDVQFSNNSTYSDKIHLEATMRWMSLAQEVTTNGGVSAYYDIANKKWSKAYRETTGYIIETFISYFKITKNKLFLDKAIEMGEWEIKVQCDDGAFGEVKPDGSIGKKIFNTGQIIIGLICLYKETADQKYLSAARKAADWLVQNQSTNGSWEKFTSQGPKTYDARVSWPLLSMHNITQDSKYFDAASKNIQWIISQQKNNGWFDNTSLSTDNSPWTHLIAYTISGLIESYVLLDKPNNIIFNSFYKAADKLLEIYNENQFLNCSFDQNWKSKDSYSCITGNAQLAIVWMQIYNFTHEKKFLDGAFSIIEQIKKTQIIDSAYKELNGGIFGSSPINGDYAPFLLINWAPKFFADALLMKQKYI